MAIDLDRLRAQAAAARRERIPLQPTQITVRQRTWPGPRLGEGTPVDVDLVLERSYKIEPIAAREIASSGGLYEEEDIKVGPFTPPYMSNGGGGYTQAQLNPVGTGLTEVLYILAGQITGKYRLVAFTESKPLRFDMVLRRIR